MTSLSSSLRESQAPVLDASPALIESPLDRPDPPSPPRRRRLSAAGLSALFRYRKTTLTLAVALTYLISFFLVAYATDVSRVALPETAVEAELLEHSWLHLQRLSATPHPYDSVANDVVHQYIWKQVGRLLTHPYIEASNDDQNQVLFNQRDVFNDNTDNTVIYYESNNILVRINGSNSELAPLLISAHFDSVPSAFGTTDDGMGIASMLALLEYYSLSTTPQPLRTLVFNFNNNEESGLLGATAFFNHPFATNVTYFLNLEGTGAGGKAILFRATDYGVTRPYRAVRLPYGSSIFQQGFANGLVHSETDYKIYKNHGLRGVDIAFYQPRSLYHTAGDSIRGSDRRALWHMLSAAKDYTEAAQTPFEASTDTAVFFDILGQTFVALPASVLVALNIGLLVLVPVLLALLAVVVVKRGTWSVRVVDALALPLALGVSVFTTHSATLFIFSLNPLVVSADYLLPTITALAVFLLTNYATLTAISRVLPVENEKVVYLIELTLFSWALVLWSTLQASTNEAAHSGEFAYPFVLTCFALAALTGLFGLGIKRRRRLGAGAFGAGAALGAEETVPLLNTGLDHYTEEPVTPALEVAQSRTFDWSVQYLFLAPVVLVTYACGDLILQGLHQTVQESLRATTMIQQFVVLFAVAWTLPLLPFVVKFNRYLVLGLVLVVLIGGFVSLYESPFTAAAPLKLRFLQTVSRGNSIVGVYGRQGFVKEVLADLPSVKEAGLNVTCVAARDGSETCYYEGPAPRTPRLEIEVLKNGTEIVAPFEPLSGEFKIHAWQNRNCVLTFNTTGYPEPGVVSPIKSVTVYQNHNASSSPGHTDSVWSGGHRDKQGNHVYRDMNGIDLIQLHKLGWDLPFHVGIQWIPNFREDYAIQTTTAMGVLLQCYYGEADAHSTPAYTELVQYAPKLVSISNMAKGLVVTEQYFEL